MTDCETSGTSRLFTDLPGLNELQRERIAVAAHASVNESDLGQEVLHLEPPRESWRPDSLRGLADGKDQEVFGGGSRAGGAAGS